MTFAPAIASLIELTKMGRNMGSHAEIPTQQFLRKGIEDHAKETHEDEVAPNALLATLVLFLSLAVPYMGAWHVTCKWVSK